MCASQCVLWNIMYAQLWLNELMCMKAAWVFFFSPAQRSDLKSSPNPRFPFKLSLKLTYSAVEKSFFEYLPH